MDRQAPKTQAPTILSLGSINADFQVRAERAPAPGAVLVAERFRRLGGGKAANVAYLAARLGVPSRLYGCVGDDELARQALAPLEEAGVGLKGVAAVQGCATGVAMITVLPDGGKAIVLAGNANEAGAGRLAGTVAAALQEAPEGSVLVCDWETSAAAVRAALEAARARGLAVVMDPSPAPRVEAGALDGLAAVTPNPAEAEALTGRAVEGPESAGRAVRDLAGRGVALPCVKLPDGGCVFLEGDRLSLVPAVPVRVVDKTGAGDAFAGALAVALLERRPPREAAGLAVAASHLAVTGYGSQPAYPTRPALEAFAGELLPQVRPLDG